MEVLIISGKSGSGKDTFANIMRKQLEAEGKRCITLHYADLVKFYCTQYYRWDGQKDEKGRTLLQTIGTNKVRAKYPDYWATAIGQFLNAVENDFDFAFIPDARFPNEIEVVQNYNPQAISIRIERYNSDGSKWINPAMTEEQLNHPSEISLDKNYTFNYIIENSGEGLEALTDAAEVLLEDIKESRNG